MVEGTQRSSGAPLGHIKVSAPQTPRERARELMGSTIDELLEGAQLISEWKACGTSPFSDCDSMLVDRTYSTAKGRVTRITRYESPSAVPGGVSQDELWFSDGTLASASIRASSPEFTGRVNYVEIMGRKFEDIGTARPTCDEPLGRSNAGDHFSEG